MLTQPRVIGSALDGEIERQFEAVFGSGIAQSTQIAQRTEARVDRVMATFRAADGIGASRVARLGVRRIVPTLAIDPPDRMDRRQVEHIEAHCADRREPRDHVIERTVAGPGTRPPAPGQPLPACQPRTPPPCSPRAGRPAPPPPRPPPSPPP